MRPRETEFIVIFAFDADALGLDSDNREDDFLIDEILVDLLIEHKVGVVPATRPKHKRCPRSSGVVQTYNY